MGKDPPVLVKLCEIPIEKQQHTAFWDNYRCYLIPPLIQNQSQENLQYCELCGLEREKLERMKNLADSLETKSLRKKLV